MRILGIDPGITTGYTLVDETGEILASGNLEPEDLDESVLVTYAQEIGIQAVIESTPIPTTSAMNRRLLEVSQKVWGLFPEAYAIIPGVWKQNRLVTALKIPNEWEEAILTPHQKDAYRIAMYYLIIVQEATS